jgi:hypothetical protein
LIVWISNIIVLSICFFSLCVQQSNEEARGGREFVLMAGFPPKDLITDIDNTIAACSLSGEAIAIRWKE